MSVMLTLPVPRFQVHCVPVPIATGPSGATAAAMSKLGLTRPYPVWRAAAQYLVGVIMVERILCIPLKNKVTSLLPGESHV